MCSPHLQPPTTPWSQADPLARGLHLKQNAKKLPVNWVSQTLRLQTSMNMIFPHIATSCGGICGSTEMATQGHHAGLIRLASANQVSELLLR